MGWAIDRRTTAINAERLANLWGEVFHAAAVGVVKLDGHIRIVK